MDNNTPQRVLSLDEVAAMTSNIQNQNSGMVTTRDLTSRTPPTPTPGIPQGILQPVDIGAIAPYKEKKRVGQDLIDTMLLNLDTAIERDQQQMWDTVISPKIEEESEKAILEESDDFNIPSLDLPYNDYQEGDIMDNQIKKEVQAPLKFNYNDQEPIVEVETIEGTVVPAKEFVTAEELGVSLIIPEVPALPQVEEQHGAVVVEPVQTQPTIPTEMVTVEEEEPDYVLTPEKLNDISNLNLDEAFGEDVPNQVEEPNEDDGLNLKIELTEEEKNQEIKQMQTKIRSEANPISKIINLANFTIGSQPVTASRVLSSMASTKQVHSATWYMPNSRRSFVMSEISGSEIQKLDPTAETALNDLMRNTELYTVFYNHIVDANKPEKFGAWAKTVAFDDIPHLYFAAYRASFSHGSNLLPYTCNSCEHSFMEHKPIDSMIKFKDSETGRDANVILAKDPTTKDYCIESTLFQVSDNICISFKTPSIHNVIFERAALPESFKTNFTDLMYIIGCIDAVYEIDHVNSKLNKVVPKIEKDNFNKTISNKYKSYAAILQALNADEYATLPLYITKIRKDHSADVSFAIPETVCPKCGKVIKEQPSNPMSLLFTRLSLQTILAISAE